MIPCGMEVNMKFRGWVTELNKYADGCTINHDGSYSLTVEEWVESHNCYGETDGYDGVLEEWAGIETTKEGVEIYEGDIIKAWSYLEEEYIIGEVKRGNRGAWMVKPTDSDGFTLPINTNFFRGISITPDSDIEIVGNIHTI